MKKRIIFKMAMATHYRRHRKNEIKRLRKKAQRQHNVLEKLECRFAEPNNINI